MWLTFLTLSVFCLAFSTVLPLVINGIRGTKTKKLKVFNFLFAGVFAAVLFVFVPAHVTTAEASVLGSIRAACLSVFNALQVFALGCDFTVVTDSMENCPPWLDLIYQVWVAILYVLAPILTFGAVLSLFKNVSAYLRYIGSYFKDIYVFSEMNEQAFALASDIKTKNKKAQLIFTNVFEDNEESVYEQARSLDAICFKKDILAVNFQKHSKNKSIWFFAIGNDETENLNQALQLIENYKNRDLTHLYIFSTKIESELLLTSVDKGKIKVRRVNAVRSLINRTLYEHGDVIFDSARKEADGNKRISAVVVGLGNHGTEMVKALAWYGQMDGYRLEINAFDKDPLAKEKFAAQAPELISPDYNGVDVEGEAQYQISIHSDVDVQTISFAEKISRINATYVFVALGEDDVNIRTAVALRMYFERMKIHPVIQAVVYNTQQKTALEGVKNYRGQAYDLAFVGDIASFYTEDVIIDSELEDDALKRHLKWGDEEEFWTYEYNYRSSMASAIHKKARVKCAIPGATKTEAELTEEERNIIEVLEHRRWNAYMRSEGYVYSGSKEKSSRNDLAKMHHDLVDFSELSEEDKRKDSKVGTD